MFMAGLVTESPQKNAFGNKLASPQNLVKMDHHLLLVRGVGVGRASSQFGDTSSWLFLLVSILE